MPSKKIILKKAGNYLKEHPEEILRALRAAFGLKIGVPIDALRYFAHELSGSKKAPKDVMIEAAPPGVRLGATVDAMGTTLRASLVIFIEQLTLSLDQILIVVRIAEMSLTVLGDASSPLAGLIKSGALDLSKPGNLVAFMPKKPPALIDAKDDRVTLDLMKVPAVAENVKIKRAIEIVTPVIGVSGITAEDDHIDIQLRADLAGLPIAFAAARSSF